MDRVGLTNMGGRYIKVLALIFRALRICNIQGLMCDAAVRDTSDLQRLGLSVH
jgi:hypothetical protein